MTHIVNTVRSCGVPPDPALLRAAQALAARGWFVFPCAPDGKRPALRGNWQDLATTDPAQILAWWTRAPYNVGLACEPSGLVVVDLDVSPGPSLDDADGNHPAASSGTDALVALCDGHGQPYPSPTYAVGTPSGGVHLYYDAPRERVRNSVGRLGLHIDIRAGGGYVIGAGSRIRGRAYTVTDQRSPAPLPAWITTLLGDNHVPTATGQKPPVPYCAEGTAYALAALREETRLVATARQGTRNDTLNRAAFNLGQLVAVGLLPPLATVTALLDAAERAGLRHDEARRTINSGLSAGARKPRA
jgi:hypothetical protein